MKILDTAKNVVERAPVLQKPAHALYTSALKTKNAVLFPLARNGLYLPKTLSDRGQDAWVVDIFAGKRDGFFLEAGAADGFSESNTYLLEKRYGWRGICVEPNPELFERLSNSGRACTCVPDLIDGSEKVVEFVSSGQESGIVGDDTDNSVAMRSDHIEALRDVGMVQSMRSKTLQMILDEHRAPDTIDYFSFDVEGAETRILRTFPFDRYRFLAMTVERPTPELNSLLFANDYVFVRNSLYDSFYVHRSHPNIANIELEPFAQIPPKGI